MTDRDWLVLIVWGCTIGMTAATVIIGIIVLVYSARTRAKYKTLLEQHEKENKNETN